jgi:hypothetical protein
MIEAMMPSMVSAERVGPAAKDRRPAPDYWLAEIG